MEHQPFDAISFEDAIAITQQRHKETTEELRHLRQELRDRDVVVKRLQAKLGKQCAAELENRKLQQELRELKDGLARLLQQDPHLRDKMTAMTAVTSEDAAATNGGTPLVPMDAVQALALNKKNYIARLPFEMQGDIFLNLDRFSLDRAGFACPQFHAVVGCLAGGSLRVLGRVGLQVTNSLWADLDPYSNCDSPPAKRKRPLNGPSGTSLDCDDSAEEDAYDFRVSVDYSSDQLALKNGSTDENVSRGWSFSNTEAATAHFIGLLRHARIIEVTLDGSLPIRLLQALSSTDVDVTIGRLSIGELALKSGHLPLARSALTSFNSLRHLTLGDDIPLDILTNDFLVKLKHVGVVEFVFRSKEFKARSRDGWAPPHVGRRVLVNTYDGDFPDLDAGLAAFLFRGSEVQDEAVSLKFPAARVPNDFCQRLLKAAMTDGSCSVVSLSFVAAVRDFKVKLEDFEECASELDDDTIVYKVPQSPASDMLLELKIIALENAPNGWKLVEFRRDKKPPPSTGGGGGDQWGGGDGGYGDGGYGGGGGWAGGGGWGGGWGGPGGGYGNGGFGGGGWGGGGDQWGGGDEYEYDDDE